MLTTKTNVGTLVPTQEKVIKGMRKQFQDIANHQILVKKAKDFTTPEAERKNALDALANQFKEYLSNLMRIPISFCTLVQLAMEDAIEDKNRISIHNVQHTENRVTDFRPNFLQQEQKRLSDQMAKLYPKEKRTQYIQTIKNEKEIRNFIDELHNHLLFVPISKVDETKMVLPNTIIRYRGRPMSELERQFVREEPELGRYYIVKTIRPYKKRDYDPMSGVYTLQDLDDPRYTYDVHALHFGDPKFVSAYECNQSGQTGITWNEYCGDVPHKECKEYVETRHKAIYGPSDLLPKTKLCQLLLNTGTEWKHPDAD